MAANSFRGEAELIVGEGEEAKTYKLCIDVNAMCYAEGHLDKTTDEIVELVETDFSSWSASARSRAVTPRFNASLTRTLLWAALQKKHPGTHLGEAGEIMTNAGPGPTAVAVLNAFFGALGTSEDGEGKEAENPPGQNEPGTG